MPVVLIEAAFIEVLPPELVVIEESAFVAPIAPDRVVTPLVLRVNACPPLAFASTTPNLIAPPPLLVTTLELVKVVVRPTADKSTVVVALMLPPNKVLPVPEIVKFFKAVVPPIAPVVMVPLPPVPLLVKVSARYTCAP